MRGHPPWIGLVLLAATACGNRDLARENSAACEAATMAEFQALGDCVDDLGTQDCDFEHDSEACDWVVHYACRQQAAEAADDCDTEGSVAAWETEVEACPPADCTPNGQDRPFFEDDAS